MAASLNASISQQKGPGLVQAIANSLMILTQGEVDSGSLNRILLPRLLKDLQMISSTDEALVMRLLDFEDQTSLSESVERIFKPLPLNRSLSDMGFELNDIHRAVSDAQSKIHIPETAAAQLKNIVEEVY